MNVMDEMYRLRRQRERNLHNKYKKVIEKFFLGKEVLIKNTKSKGFVKNFSNSIDFLVVLTETGEEIVVNKRQIKIVENMENIDQSI